MKKNKLLYIGHPKTIMAIDASTNSMAFSIFKEGVLHKFGKINFHGKVIESAIYTNSQKTAMNLALVQGAIIGSAQTSGNRVVASCSPVAWQNWIGNGKLKKEEKLAIRDLYGHDKSFSWYKQKEREFRKARTIKKINIEFDLNVEDDDVADSIAIGWYSSNNWHKLANEPTNVDKAQG